MTEITEKKTRKHYDETFQRAAVDLWLKGVWRLGSWRLGGDWGRWRLGRDWGLAIGVNPERPVAQIGFK